MSDVKADAEDHNIYMEDGWFLPRSALSELAALSLEETIRDAKQSHIVAIILRLSGKNIYRQADWIKYLRPGPSD